MAGLSGDRHYFLKNTDFAQMIEDGVFPKRRANIPILDMTDNRFHIVVSSGQAIKIERWLDNKYSTMENGVRIIRRPGTGESP